MTSRTLSINLFKGEIWRRRWLYLLTVIVMLLLRPVRLLMAIDSVNMWGTNLSVAEKVNSVMMYARFNNENNLLLLFLFSIAYAFSCFRYLYSKSRVDLYHSIPLKRTAMYKVFSLSALIPYYIFELLILVCNIAVLGAKGMLIGYSIKTVISTSIYYIVMFTFIFAVALIAIFITGQMVTGVLGALVFIFGWVGITDLIDSYKAFCYQSYYSSSRFSWVNFILSPFNALSGLERWIGDGVLKFIVLCVETAILYLFAMWLYKIRPSDGMNKGVCYRILNPIIRIPCVIYGALIGGLYVGVLSESLNAGWYWVAFVIIGIITHVIVLGLLHSDTKNIKNSLIQLLGALVAAAVIALFLIYDVTGYDRYIPQRDKVESVSVEFAGLHDDMSSYKLEESASGYDFIYEDMSVYRLEHMNSNDVDTALALAKLGIENLDPRRSAFARRNNNNEARPMKAIEDVAVDKRVADGTAAIAFVESEFEYYDQPNTYRIKYHLKSGKDIYRSYNVSMDDSYALTEKVYNTPEYKDSILQVGDFIDNNKINSITAVNRMGEVEFILKNEQAIAFVRALEEDYRNASLEEMATNYPVYSISSSSLENNYEDYMYGYYIYPNFNNSLKLLESYGINLDTGDTKLDLGRIESITVSRYDENIMDTVKMTYEKGKDDAMIKDIYDIMIVDNFTYVNSILKKYEQRVDVECNYIADNGYMMSYYMRIPRGEMPKKAFEDVGIILAE